MLHQFVSICLQTWRMGVGSSEPVYNLAKLQDFHHLDTLPVRYLWIDMKITSKQNQAYLAAFREVANLEDYSNFTAIQKAIGMVNTAKERIRVLCSASLPDHVYEFVQSNDAIQRGLLFCSNRTKAGILMGSYPKIKTACFGYEQVIRTFKAWQRDEIETIYFFEEKDISKLHRATVNWYTLTDIDASITPEMKDVFMMFCNKVLKEQAPIFTKELQSSKIKEPASLVSYAMEENFLLKEVNQLLRATKNPAKLAYIRWPVIELYTFIKKNYQNIKNKGSISLYGLLVLNSEERRRLQPGKCINIIQFIKTTQSIPQKTKEETLIEIKVVANKQICNGYNTTSQGTLFNIGNFYQVEAYNPDQNTLTVLLLSFDTRQPIKQHDLRSSVLLNQLKIGGMEVIKEGQWYSLLLGGYIEGAKEYLNRISKIQSKKRDNKEMIKCFVLREKTKVKLGSPLENSIEKLERICKSSQVDDQIILYTLATISQLSLVRKKYAKFLSTFIELSRTLDTLKIKKISCSIPAEKIKILQIAFQMIENQENKEILKRVAKSIQEFESNLIKTKNHMIASGIYLFCLQVKAQCYNFLENYQVQIQILDRILWILGYTWGHEHHEFKLAQQNKKLAFEKQNKQINQIDLLLKKQLQSSNITIEQLLHQDAKLKLDTSNIDFSIYL